MKLFSRQQPGSKSLLAIISETSLGESLDNVGKVIPDLATTVKTTSDPISECGKLVNGSADIVVVEADMRHPSAIEAIQRLTSYVTGSGSLLVITRNGSASTVRQLFHMGVSDVLEYPVDEQELSSSISTLLSTPRRATRPARQGRIISIQNAGGGAGGSTVAINLAQNLANRRKASSGSKPRILLVDFDPQFGNLAALLDKDGKTSLMDLIQAGDRLDESFISTTVQEVTPGLDLLAAPREILPLSALSKSFCDRMLDAAIRQYDYIILDHSQNWGGQTQPVLSRSDAILLVLRPCHEHAERAQAVLKGLDDLKIERTRVLAVANQAQGLAHKDRISRIGEVLSRPVEALPLNDKLHKAAREKSRFLADISGSKPTVKALSRIADNTLAIINTAVFADEESESTSHSVSSDGRDYSEGDRL